MNNITHIFFDLNGVLIDPELMRSCYSARLGEFMAERYGQTSSVWTLAYQRIVADWDSYYADLDLDGDEGLKHLWEGLYRTTRALFRLTGVPEPAQEELTALSRSLPGRISQRCNASFADVLPVLQELHDSGFTLGVISHLPSQQAQGSLIGSTIDNFFTGNIVGPDTIDRFIRDERFFQLVAGIAQVSPAACMLVGNLPDGLHGAKAAGFQTVQLCRTVPIRPVQHADYVMDDLRGLLRVLSG